MIDKEMLNMSVVVVAVLIKHNLKKRWKCKITSMCILNTELCAVPLS